MNPGRGWNHDLEESYIPKYNEFDAEMFTYGTLEFYLRFVKILALGPSSISRYCIFTKTTSFSILGFFKSGVKLGFDFPEVLLNQNL